MEEKYLTEDSFRQILQEFSKYDKASISRSNSDTPFEQKTITFDLSVARTRENAMKIGFPFKSIYVSSASDANTRVNFIPDSIDNFQDAVPLSNKDSLSFELAKGDAFLYWDAQVGKTLTITFFITGNFKSGSYLTQAIGSSGSTFTNETPVTVSTSSTLLKAVDLVRTSLTLYNSGSTDMYIGGSSVSTTNGILLASGERVKISNNTGAIYGIVASGSTTCRLLSES